MADFDLIPEDYKYWQWQRSCMKRTAMILLACSVLVLLLTAWLRAQSSRHGASVIDLQRQLAMSRIQQEQMSSLAEIEQRLRAHLKLLEGLRGAARVESTMRTVDDALRGHEVWFLNWQFQQVMEKLARSAAPQTTAYLIDFTNHLAGNKTESLSLDTLVTISGQARDHSALSEFVQRLAQSSNVLEVKIARTSLAMINDNNIVEFNIQVSISNNAVSSSG